MFTLKYENLFYNSLRIRLVEEKIVELYSLDKIQSPVHLSIGQEAIAVGICDNLKKDDLIFINYRGHAFYLAKGASLFELFAELYGKSTGFAKGKGGSMHLAFPKKGVMGASAVVASTIPHAVGAALASKIRGEDKIFVAIFGDGATGQGVYHESLNFASLHKLNVLFLCENNGLAAYTPIVQRQSFDFCKHVKSYGIEYVKIDEGYDFELISSVSKGVIDEIRRKNQPMFLEIKACRYKEHVGPGDDPDGSRDIQAVNAWKKLDPLIANTKLINKFSLKIKEEINEAVDFAENSPMPQHDDLLRDVI